MDEQLLFFQYKHLPPQLQTVSKPFCNLAHDMAQNLPKNSQQRAVLSHLLIAKDAAVRAVLLPSLIQEQSGVYHAQSTQNYEKLNTLRAMDGE